MIACENVILFALLVSEYHFFFYSVHIFGKFEEEKSLQSGWGGAGQGGAGRGRDRR